MNLMIEFDDPADVVIIEGVRYSCGLFRGLGISGLEVGRLIRIIARSEDGIIILQSYAPGERVTA